MVLVGGSLNDPTGDGVLETCALNLPVLGSDPVDGRSLCPWSDMWDCWDDVTEGGRRGRTDGWRSCRWPSRGWSSRWKGAEEPVQEGGLPSWEKGVAEKRKLGRGFAEVEGSFVRPLPCAPLASASFCQMPCQEIGGRR